LPGEVKDQRQQGWLELRRMTLAPGSCLSVFRTLTSDRISRWQPSRDFEPLTMMAD
jgi:hypothetical protein